MYCDVRNLSGVNNAIKIQLIAGLCAEKPLGL